MRNLVLVFLICLSFGLYAQTNEPAPQPAYWLVQKVNVKANATQEYELNIKQLIMSLQVGSKGCSPFNWFTFVSPDQAVYTYVTPVMDFAHLQSIYQAMSNQSSTLSQLHQSISGEVNSYDVSFLRALDNLSYQPPQGGCVQPYNIVECLDVIPGQEANFEKMLSTWVKGATGNSGWSVFVTLIGPNQPQYSIVYNGASLNSFQKQFAQQSQNFAAGQGFGILRGYSWSSNIYVPELSNVNSPAKRRSVTQPAN